MLPKLRRVSSLLRNSAEPTTTTHDQVISSTEHLSSQSQSSSSSNKSLNEGNNVYVETLLYIVHVDDIDLPFSADTNEETSNVTDEQESIVSRPLVRRLSKRTTASFNERHPTPIYARPSFSFTNPLRRLNSLLKTNDKSSQSPSTPKRQEHPLCSSTAKKTSTVRDPSYSQNSSNNNHRNQCDDPDYSFPPPPPSFLFDPPPSTNQSQSMIRATGPGLSDGFVDEQCHFDLTAPNAELQKLVIAIDGPSKADIQIEVVETGVYRVFYTCQASGNYHISLTYDGIHISGSPYHLSLRSPPHQEQVVPPTLPAPMMSPTATIEPTEFYVNSACIVTVRPTVPCTVFQAFIQAPQKNINLPITVHKSGKSDCYEIYFVPTICGNYWLNVSLNHIPIVDNPCRLLVRSNSSTKPILASGQGLFHAYTGETSQFFVSKSPSDPQAEKGTFSVGISGPSTVFLDANETEHGYEFHYKPLRPGKYIITIKNGGKHIQGSPFICRVYNKLSDSRLGLSTMYETEQDANTESTTQGTASCPSLNSPPAMHNPIATTSTTSTNQVDLNILRSSMSGDPSQVCVFGTGLYEAKPRRKASFKIDASQAGPGLLLVGLYSPLGPSERLVVKRIMPSSPGFIYKVSYRVRARGQYMLVILYGANMEHVPGSPYLVTVE